MNLDNPTSFASIDQQNYLAEIDGLPHQLHTAWELGNDQWLPAWKGIRHVLIAGMGGSAIGADLLAAYAAPLCQVPITIHRNYGLPAWAQGPEVLVIASSYSGNTEETLSAFESAQANGCRILAQCTGGKLADVAQQAGVPLWTFYHRGQPRAAVGHSFGLLLAILSRLELVPSPSNELVGAIAAMQTQQDRLRADVPAVHNLAKRLAGQLAGRWVVVFGADILEPVARRWKGQVNELAKAWAQFESLPEADHNTLAGTIQPEHSLPTAVALFLRASSCQPRNLQRINLTKQALMLEGLSTDFVDAQGDTPLAQQWTALLLGDYVAYYLSMVYRINPTPIEALTNFKQELASI